MIFARTAAMLFNRIVDWSLDRRNERTATRHLLVSRSSALILLVLSSLTFLVCAFAINRMTRVLAIPALVIIFFYSMTKRFTHATHFFLGLALAVAPIGAWLAQTGHFAWPPLILGLGVICWVTGFDMIYATQDYEFDRRENLHSLVVVLGVSNSLKLAQWLHSAAFVALIAFGLFARLGVIYFGSLLLVAIALFYEHRIAKKLDVGAINRAFFQSNAFVSAVFLIAVCLDCWL
jgi:4-hydroxybenzoate polyprenyltransferase